MAKAELGEVVDEVKRVAVYVGIAIGVAIAAGLLLAVGLPLFLGEWIFGSIGWGILHGLLLLLGIGVAAVVLALGVSAAAVGRSVATGLVTGVVVGMALGLNLTNRGWGVVGDALLPRSDAGVRPLGRGAHRATHRRRGVPGAAGPDPSIAGAAGRGAQEGRSAL